MARRAAMSLRMRVGESMDVDDDDDDDVAICGGAGLLIGPGTRRAKRV